MISTIGAALAERGYIPTALERRAIRAICAERLRDAGAGDSLEEFIGSLQTAPIAPVTTPSALPVFDPHAGDLPIGRSAVG